MPLSINFKATRGIIIVGHMAELDHDQIAQHFTPHVVSLLIDHLPEKFLPPEESTHTTIGNIRETCHVLYIQDNGRVMDALFSITKNEKKHLMETIYQTMKMLDVEVPGLRKCIRLLKKKITETSNNDEGLPLTQGEHDAFIKKINGTFRLRDAIISEPVHMRPSGLMVAEDHSSKFYMNFWARSGDKPINVLSYQERADLDQD
ncbi:hypothetical protein PSHT_14101 [Puccinia striiformis]|uniref:Uncharacterized protein n=1 Tax=Puccinia striiformis TaxID=27350 RepID=A0A2S4UMF2_9BASI|nr:hypothetical protein PSHT_14101 [Puccinia striiformis]